MGILKQRTEVTELKKTRSNMQRRKVWRNLCCRPGLQVIELYPDSFQIFKSCLERGIVTTHKIVVIRYFCDCVGSGLMDRLK